jgi:hypothetical protein
VHPDVIDRADRATVVVGRGRGFVVDRAGARLVITAAACLPHLPSSNIDPFVDQRSFSNLLAPLRGQPCVCAQCLFVDPVSNLAVMGPVEGEGLIAEVRDYEALMQSVGTLQIGHVQGDTSASFMLRDRGWVQCTISYRGRGPLWVRDAAAVLKGSMPGSPIITNEGFAIGIVASAEDEGSGAPQPALADHLPGWLLRDLSLMDRARPSA